MLSAMLLTIIGVVLYVYKDSLLPAATNGEGESLTSRVNIPSVSDKDPFFDREDYRALRPTVGVPVQPLQVRTTDIDPFRATISLSFVSLIIISPLRHA